MRLYAYEAVNTDGRSSTGHLRAESERQALRSLEGRGLSVVAIRASDRPGRARRNTRLRSGDIIVSLQELGTMLTSGVPVADAVASQAMSGHHPRIVSAYAGMSSGLQRGQSFSLVLEASGLPLPGYVIQLVRAGELTGELGRAIRDAGQQMEYEQRVRNDIRNALVYPTVLVLAGVAAVTLMFVFVVPKFSSMLDRAESLPFLAWAVLATGVWMRTNFALFVGVVAAVAVAAYLLARRPKVRTQVVDAIARLPLVGAWLVEADTSRWARVMSALLTNRVPLMRALELAAGGVQIPSRHQRMQEVTRAVRGGTALASALEMEEALTPTGYNLVRVGERSGKLAEMLESLARLYEDSGRNRMKRLLLLIEPVAILMIGSVIGTIILGIILAITSANDLAI
ncbi:type II secretion system protein [Luteimonas chenhongjianii]|uniref:Type II secretion system protein n=1 Tax=Luteimonas chenhongjianii TaxID=2006110 RepID=A0A290XHA9_9GAMM|nr:type II secretion system F family protein [Luteimonas chenhongjianii]ATD68552.1 type II secretion system protein [Luteimonas chenhongjianii]